MNLYHQRVLARSIARFVLWSLFGAIMGAFIGLVVWLGMWSHWNDTIYQPWLQNQHAQGLDDGGSSEGWVLLLGALPALLFGGVAGAIIPAVRAMYLKKRAMKAAHLDLSSSETRDVIMQGDVQHRHNSHQESYFHW